MVKDTRKQLLDTAEALFAERGFYGVSIAAIADQLCLTKQALLHHFGSKEKLYGEVLKRISAQYELTSSQLDSSDFTPAEKLKSYLLLIFESTQSQNNRSKLLMRELLDNNERAATAGAWYLKPFLDHLIDMVRNIPEWQDASKAENLALVYQLLGAINYYAVSAPTLTGILGPSEFTRLQEAFPKQLERLLEASLAFRNTA